MQNKDLKRIVRFTLHKYSVKAKWRIIHLNANDWKRLMEERTLLEKESANNMNRLLHAYENGDLQRAIEEGYIQAEKVAELLKLHRESLKEYNKYLSYEELLTSHAIFINLKEFSISPTILKPKFNFSNSLVLKYTGLDFIILTNPSAVSQYSFREKLITIVHETLHYVEAIHNDRTDFTSIEEKAQEIVGEFLGEKVN